MDKKIVLLTRETESSIFEGATVGLLLETSSDGSLIQHYPDAILMSTLLGNAEVAKQKASALAAVLLANEPLVRGVPQLSVFQEVTIRELQQIFQLLHLKDFLLAHQFSVCEFVGASSYASGFKELVALLQLPLQVVIVEKALPRVQRGWAKIKASRWSIKELYQLAYQVVTLWDPFHRFFLMFNSLKPKRKITKGQLWFYSTAVTYTDIGLRYEPFFPEAFQFLIANPMTGGRPLKRIKRPYVFLYEFGARKWIPEQQETDQAMQLILSHLQSVQLSVIESTVRDVFIKSAWLRSFFARNLPQGLFFGSIFTEWFHTVEPKALVVGNPCFEGYALYMARQRGIPTILLQHGILGDFYQYADLPVDHLIVRGEFWYRFLNEQLASRALILNPPVTTLPSQQMSVERTYIVFCTFGFCQQDVVRTLISAMAGTGVELVIRVHPLERVVDYQNVVEQIQPTFSQRVRVRYSQGSGLDELLQGAMAVVLQASTVFLECIRYNTPIISLGWYAFAYRRQIESRKVFYLAENLEHLKTLVQTGISGRLAPYLGGLEEFIANTPMESMQNRLRALIWKGN